MSESIVETKTTTTRIEPNSSPTSWSNTHNDEDIIRSIGNINVASPQSIGNDEIQRTSFNRYQRRNSDAAENTLFNWGNIQQRSSSTNALDQLTINQDSDEMLSADAERYPLSEDPNPEHIRRPNKERITYRQDIAIRYLQPPTPPPAGPIIIREIRAPQPPEPPPLVIRQRLPAPATPPPIVIRERPPVPPAIEPPRIVERYLPAPAPPPRKVIIERQAPLPNKPQPIIIEKWLPYRPQGERRTVIERAAPYVPKPPPKNTIITVDAPQVNFVKNVRNLGTVRANPRAYAEQYNTHLASSDYVLNTMARYGIANNYTQMIQGQTSPRTSRISINQVQPIDDNDFLNQQSVGYGEQQQYSASSSPSNGHRSDYATQFIVPDEYRQQRSNFNEYGDQDFLRQAEMNNYD